MNTKEIVNAINAEIQRLQRAKGLISGEGRSTQAQGRRTMSAEARARIAAAQKARRAREKNAS